MTSIAFHFNVPAKLSYACRLLRKGVASGATLGVVTDARLISQLDAQLWSFSALDFVPHARADQPGGMSAEQLSLTPVWLCSELRQALGRQVLVNLTTDVLPGFEQFERVIEVVTLEEPERQAARQRWRYYSERGYEIIRHDLKLQDSGV